MLKKNEINKLLIESALIIFSVLFALFINRFAENIKMQNQKKVALQRISNELKSNQKLLDDVISRHSLILRNINRVMTNQEDSLRKKLFAKNYFDFTLLSEGKSIFPRLPSSTSWEVAKSTGIIAAFDYDVLEALTDTYSSKQSIEAITLPKIIDELFKVGDNTSNTKLLVLQLEFEELVAQEKTMRERIAEALQKIEN